MGLQGRVFRNGQIIAYVPIENNLAKTEIA